MSAGCWACLDARGKLVPKDIKGALPFLKVHSTSSEDGYRPGFHATLFIRLGATEECVLEAASQSCAPLRVDRIANVYCCENARRQGEYSAGLVVQVKGVGALKDAFFQRLGKITGKARCGLEAIHDPYSQRRENVDQLHVNLGTVEKEHVAETLDALKVEFSGGILCNILGTMFRAVSIVTVDSQRRNHTRNIALCGRSPDPLVTRLALEDRAVSVKLLREFWTRHKNQLENGAMTTAQTVSQIIVPATRSSKQSYAGTMYEPGLVGPCDFFVSHAWRYPLKALVECVLAHAQANDSERLGLLYWIDVFGANQHDLYAPTEIPALDRCVRAARGTVLIAMPWHSPIVLTRVWCLYELLRTEQFERPLELEIAEGEAADLSERLVADFHSITKGITAIDSAAAQATNAQDLTNIRGMIEASIGFHALNTLSKDRIREWLARKALEELWKRVGDQGAVDDGLSAQWGIARLQRALMEIPPPQPTAPKGQENQEWQTTLHFANQVAQLHGDLGRFSIAKSLYEAVLEARARASGPLLDQCHVANNLAFLLIKSRELERAKQILQEHITLIQPLALEPADAARATGSSASHEATDLSWLMKNNLAMAIGAETDLQPDRFRQAHDMYLEVLHARNALYDTPDGNNAHSIATMNNLAWLLAKRASSRSASPEEELQASQQAENFFTKVHAYRLKVHGKRHSSTVNAEQNLAQVLHRQPEKRDLAAKMQLHVCEAKVENMGVKNASTQRSIRILVEFLRSNADSEANVRLADLWSKHLVPM